MTDREKALAADTAFRARPEATNPSESVAALGKIVRLGLRRCPDHFTPDGDCPSCLCLSAASASLAVLMLRCVTAEMDWSVMETQS